MKFKFDAYTNFTKDEKEIAKAIWESGRAIAIGNSGRYKVPKEMESVIGSVRFWPHNADQIISTVPGRKGTIINVGDPYVLIYKDYMTKASRLYRRE